MKRVLVVLASAGALMMPTPPASAGGWWSYIDLDSKYLPSGGSVTIREEVWFSSLEEADEARGTAFHAYLVRGLDWSMVDAAMSKAEPGDWWALGEAEAIEVGRVVLNHWDVNVAIARARLNIRDVPLGRYALMFCDAGCRDALADIVPSRVQVVADPATATLAATAERLRVRLSRVGSELRRMDRSADEMRWVAADVSDLQGELAELRTELSAVEARGTPRPQTPWIAFAGWFVAGAASVASFWLALRTRRIRRAAVVIPEDARELVGSP